MNNDYDIALVEKYFDQELTEAEVSEFNTRLASDFAFKALVDQEKILIQGIHAEGLHRDLQYLKSLERTLSHEPVRSLEWPGKKWHYAAAAAVVFFISAVGIWMYSSQPTSEQLFMTYYDKPYPNIFDFDTRGATQQGEAFKAYERGDYAQAAKLFPEAIKVEQNRDEIPGMLMLLGNANLSIGNTKEAEQNFTTLLNNYDELDMPAKWYLSLCYLKNGDVEKARKMLKELGQTEVSYATRAKELLKKVD